MNQFNDSIFPFIFKEYLVYSIWFFGITASLLFVTLIVHKLLTEYRATRKKRYYDEYSEKINGYLQGSRPVPKYPKKNVQYEAFADVCIELLSNVSKMDLHAIKKLLFQSLTVEHFRSMVSSSKWTKRFYAVDMLGFFMSNTLKDLYLDIVITDTNAEVRARALWALSLIADKEDLDSITRMLCTEISNSSKFNEYIFTNLITSFKKRDAVFILLSDLDAIKNDDTIPMIVKRDLIAACGAAGLEEGTGIIYRYFSSFSQDILMRIACIRALGELGSLDARTAIDGMMSMEWRTRAVSAKAAVVNDDIVLMGLKKLLYDPVYVVRINAAKKLSLLGEEGLRILREEMISDDRFVRDTVRFILNREGVHV